MEIGDAAYIKSEISIADQFAQTSANNTVMNTIVNSVLDHPIQ